MKIQIEVAQNELQVTGLRPLAHKMLENLKPANGYSVDDLAKLMGLDRTNAYHPLGMLRGAGYIYKCDTEGRMEFWALTDKAIEVLDRLKRMKAASVSTAQGQESQKVVDFNIPEDGLDKGHNKRDGEDYKRFPSLLIAVADMVARHPELSAAFDAVINNSRKAA